MIRKPISREQVVVLVDGTGQRVFDRHEAISGLPAPWSAGKPLRTSGSSDMTSSGRAGFWPLLRCKIRAPPELLSDRSDLLV